MNNSSSPRANRTPISPNNAISQQSFIQGENSLSSFKASLSVILPAYNEEQVIASTINTVLKALNGRIADFEVIVVNDGSRDGTKAIIEAIALLDSHVRLISHEVNRGYGAALVDGFAAASKELTFFMDSDGQFDINDLFQFFLYIANYDAVIGYRIDRRDSWIRKLNAWSWKVLIGIVLGVHVRDIDCAFKLLRTDFLHAYPLESRGATINAELLYKLILSDSTYHEVGVQHLPRRGGQATGAHPRVIVQALRELFLYSREWHQAERGVHQFTTAKTLQH